LDVGRFMQQCGKGNSTEEEVPVHGLAHFRCILTRPIAAFGRRHRGPTAKAETCRWGH
jgi:hypothetical protein